jgi:hypothetical protein
MANSRVLKTILTGGSALVIGGLQPNTIVSQHGKGPFTIIMVMYIVSMQIRVLDFRCDVLRILPDDYFFQNFHLGMGLLLSAINGLNFSFSLQCGQLLVSPGLFQASSGSSRQGDWLGESPDRLLI